MTFRVIGLAILAIGAMAAGSSIGYAQDGGNPRAGLDVAQKVCAECHEVEPGDGEPLFFDAPSFTDIANTPGMTALALKVWLQTSHPTMPNLILSAEEKDNVIAYITSLREAK